MVPFVLLQPAAPRVADLTELTRAGAAELAAGGQALDAGTPRVSPKQSLAPSPAPKNQRPFFWVAEDFTFFVFRWLEHPCVFSKTFDVWFVALYVFSWFRVVHPPFCSDISRGCFWLHLPAKGRLHCLGSKQRRDSKGKSVTRNGAARFNGLATRQLGVLVLKGHRFLQADCAEGVVILVWFGGAEDIPRGRSQFVLLLFFNCSRYIYDLIVFHQKPEGDVFCSRPLYPNVVRFHLFPNVVWWVPR